MEVASDTCPLVLRLCGVDGVEAILLRAWKERWMKFLPFRNVVGQGKRCRVCARFDEERKAPDHDST